VRPDFTIYLGIKQASEELLIPMEEFLLMGNSKKDYSVNGLEHEDFQSLAVWQKMKPFEKMPQGYQEIPKK
jgi:hypothetical protein